jgi:hypothetical protein
VGLVFAQVAPASATVQGIVAQWCSGHDPLAPPGISDDTKPNFAQPLNASGFIQGTTDFTGDAGPGQRIVFDFHNPNAKVVQTSVWVVIGQVPDPETGVLEPLYLNLVQRSSNFPAFEHCPRMFTLAEWSALHRAPIGTGTERERSEASQVAPLSRPTWISKIPLVSQPVLVTSVRQAAAVRG